MHFVDSMTYPQSAGQLAPGRDCDPGEGRSYNSNNRTRAGAGRFQHRKHTMPNRQEGDTTGNFFKALTIVENRPSSWVNSMFDSQGAVTDHREEEPLSSPSEKMIRPSPE